MVKFSVSLIEDILGNAVVAMLVRMAQHRESWRSMVAPVNQDTAHRLSNLFKFL